MCGEMVIAVRIVNWVLAVRFGVDGIEQGLMRCGLEVIAVRCSG